MEGSFERKRSVKLSITIIGYLGFIFSAVSVENIFNFYEVKKVM